MRQTQGQAVLADFGDFYRGCAGRVLVYLARRCFEPEVAVDLMAESFALAFEERDRFRGHSREEAEAWVFGIARKQLADYFRRGSIERRALARVGIELPDLEPAEHDRLVELAGLGRLRTAVTREFDRLSPDQQAAVRLRVIDEKSYREVAESLEISEPVARARVSRGLRRLAGRIDQKAFAEGAGRWAS
jgi:RNA polymerase sigma factor (sigma-70 family)